MLGFGVTINMLFGDNGGEALSKCIGKTISGILIDDDKLNISFDNNTTLTLWDDGQSCCEYRYMVCDDQPFDYYTGAKLLGIEIKDGPDEEIGEYGDMFEVQFLEVMTDKGSFQVANHNEHNGYYGGFSINATLKVNEQ